MSGGTTGDEGRTEPLHGRQRVRAQQFGGQRVAVKSMKDRK
jgi:hypothetical protein